MASLYQAREGLKDQVEQGKDVNAFTNGTTPLHEAAKSYY